ncbi:hypothetical protein ABIB94_007052 [Bradyrhizobium sp. JR7.2]|uniref:hypothetical protein n=1 Tax=Bradyrhizobium sp. JR7.2 TaxID=3156375 RepID=UPI00339830D9
MTDTVANGVVVLGEIHARREKQIAILGEIHAERSRQIAKGYDAAHDDEHSDGSIARAAASYAWSAAPLRLNYVLWPWPSSTWSPGPPREALVKAAALIVAEIERMDRSDDASVRAFMSGPDWRKTSHD